MLHNFLYSNSLMDYWSHEIIRVLILCVLNHMHVYTVVCVGIVCVCVHAYDCCIDHILENISQKDVTLHNESLYLFTEVVSDWLYNGDRVPIATLKSQKH